MWLLGGALTVMILVVALAAVLLPGSSPPEITSAQFGRVAVGDAKQQVSAELGGSGESGSIVSGFDPEAVEVPDVAGQQFRDCWTYALAGSGVSAGSDAAICFVADRVVYTRIRTG